MKEIFGWLSVIGLSIGGMFFRLFAITKLWSWIAVPLFAASPIGLWQAFGITAIIGLITFNPEPKKEKDTLESATKKVVTSIFATAFSLGFAYLFFT